MPESARSPLSRWLEAAWSHHARVGAVDVEGAAIRYREWGEPAADGSGLAFVHGFLAHARWWDHIAPHFAARHHVIAPDFSGMGDSDRRPEYSRRQYAREIVAALSAAGIADATIIAHSFGAISSLLAARLAPGVIRRVIVLDAFVFRPEANALPSRSQTEKRYVTRAEALARYRLVPPGEWPVPEVRDYLAGHSLREEEGLWSWKFDPRILSSIDSESVRDELRGLPTPVDFVRAANSEVVTDAALQGFVENMPRCGTPVTVPLSHHHLMIEQPVALVAAIEGLLANPR